MAPHCKCHLNTTLLAILTQKEKYRKFYTFRFLATPREILRIKQPTQNCEELWPEVPSVYHGQSPEKRYTLNNTIHWVPANVGLQMD
jgi:hypothetical protein